MADPIRVLLVDDHFLLRTGLASVLSLEPDIVVCSEADNGEEAIALHKQLRPDVTLMDLHLPGIDGLTATIRIRAETPGARIVILTNYGGDEEIYEALHAGAQAYLLKSVRRDELLMAIRKVASGQTYIPPDLASRLAERVRRAGLSAREKEVLLGIARGQRNQDIARELGISEITVKHHVSSIIAKLGVSDRTGALAAAIERGIIRVE
jgi:DNA-binding NarL/FixJ family response regulator